MGICANCGDEAKGYTCSPECHQEYLAYLEKQAAEAR